MGQGHRCQPWDQFPENPAGLISLAPQSRPVPSVAAVLPFHCGTRRLLTGSGSEGGHVQLGSEVPGKENKTQHSFSLIHKSTAYGHSPARVDGRGARGLEENRHARAVLCRVVLCCPTLCCTLMCCGGQKLHPLTRPGRDSLAWLAPFPSADPARAPIRSRRRGVLDSTTDRSASQAPHAALPPVPIGRPGAA
jgi:hypothetical protein